MGGLYLHSDLLPAVMVNSTTIPYPNHPSEREVQAELWEELKYWDIDARLEVIHMIPSLRKKSKQRSKYSKNQFDVVVYKEKKAVCLIEVKREGKKITKDTRQHRKYSSYDIPLLYCIGSSQIEETVDSVRRLLGQYPIHLAPECWTQPVQKYLGGGISPLRI